MKIHFRLWIVLSGSNKINEINQRESMKYIPSQSTKNLNIITIVHYNQIEQITDDTISFTRM